MIVVVRFFLVLLTCLLTVLGTASVGTAADAGIRVSDLADQGRVGDAAPLTLELHQGCELAEYDCASGSLLAAKGGANPLKGTRYTDKVRGQMQPNPRTGRPDYHGFPREVDNFAGQGTRSTIRGADGIERTRIELPGSLNGKDGVFEWIIEPGGAVNHRLFRPNG